MKPDLMLQQQCARRIAVFTLLMSACTTPASESPAPCSATEAIQPGAESNLLTDSLKLSAFTSSYLITGLSYAADGLVLVTTGTVSFAVQCMPLLFAMSASSISSDTHHLCLGDKIYYYDPKTREKAWRQTESWRNDPALRQLNEQQLDRVACAQQAGDVKSLKQASLQLHATMQSPSWEAASDTQRERASRLDSELKHSLLVLDPAEAQKLAAEKARFSALFADLNRKAQITRHPQTGEEWFYLEAELPKTSFPSACEHIPVAPNTTAYHLAAVKQFKRAKAEGVFEKLTQGDRPSFVVLVSTGGRFVAQAVNGEETAEPTGDSFSVLCVR